LKADLVRDVRKTRRRHGLEFFEDVSAGRLPCARILPPAPRRVGNTCFRCRDGPVLRGRRSVEIQRSERVRRNSREGTGPGFRSPQESTFILRASAPVEGILTDSMNSPYLRPISRLAIASATLAGFWPLAALSAQMALRRAGISAILASTAA
jgi:hypothetical protein